MQAYALDYAATAPVLRLVPGGKTSAQYAASSVDLRIVQSGEIETIESVDLFAESVEADTALVTAITLAWLGGVAHECMHPFSEVLIDEGSTPIEFPCGVGSKDVLQKLTRRGFVVREDGLDDDVRYLLTEAGENELAAQRASGLLAAIIPANDTVRWVDVDEGAVEQLSQAWAMASAEYDGTYECEVVSDAWSIAAQDWQG